jgi:predicted metalloprotease with PDZ domain
VLALPRWAPGAYRLAEFGRHAADVAAAADGRAARVAALPDGRWVVDVRPGPAARAVPWRALRVEYRVRFPSAAAAATPNNRNFLRADGALLDGPLTYAYVAGQERLPAHVRLELPAGWRAVTGLEPTADPAVFFARSYDVLVDAPVLAGRRRRCASGVRRARRAAPGGVLGRSRARGAPAFDTRRSWPPRGRRAPRSA